ncbi:MAG: dicarboxylate/amino acid:cation symporter [Thiotrichales bacterium]|nr:MAG: dicarboxylate/amino acid:cation symporter [Thiotrichales bacterium]
MKKYYFSIAIIFGIASGYSQQEFIYELADGISSVFVNLLKLVSIPILFLSIVSTISGMTNTLELKSLSRSTIRYTLITTVIAASIALGLFLIIQPIAIDIHSLSSTTSPTFTASMQTLLDIVPSNIVQPFNEGNIIGVLMIAILLSIAIISLPAPQRELLHTFFTSMHAATMKIVSYIIKLLPIAVFGFIVLFMRELQLGLALNTLGKYLLCIVLANLVQAFIVLPLFLKSKKIKVIPFVKHMWPALMLAFWSKSSSAALPLSLKCAEKAGINSKVAKFTLPLCTTINMNACAAFIITTVLFVAISHGATFSTAELLLWVVIATIAAVGNAGVPMGCYFIASALLAYMDVPLYLLGIILPFYSIIDMLESSINVWSDCCVTKMVDGEQ